MIKPRIKVHSGFTLVETLVAITILMIAVAGPLVIASKALSAAVDAKNQLIANGLAQEMMEFLQNTVDNGNWALVAGDAGTGAVCTASTNGGKPGPCGATAVQNDNVTDPNPSEIQSCRFGNINGGLNHCIVALDSSHVGYNYRPGAPNTVFVRSFYTTDPPALGGGGTDPTIQEVLVTVTVSWTTGTVYNEVKLQKIMSSVPK